MNKEEEIRYKNIRNAENQRFLKCAGKKILLGVQTDTVVQGKRVIAFDIEFCKSVDQKAETITLSSGEVLPFSIIKSIGPIK